MVREMGAPMTDEQIKHMVNRFLCWKLPDNFRPDGGISFDRVANLGTEHQYYREPVGTNLLDAVQAEAMVLHMVGGMSQQQRQDRGGGVPWVPQIGDEVAVNEAYQAWRDWQGYRL